MKKNEFNNETSFKDFLDVHEPLITKRSLTDIKKNQRKFAEFLMINMKDTMVMIIVIIKILKKVEEKLRLFLECQDNIYPDTAIENCKIIIKKKIIKSMCKRVL